jgi:heavy metal sensor kinase
MFRTLATRLTFLYTLLFAALSLVVFIVVSNHLEVSLLQRIDDELLADGREFSEVYQKAGMEALAQEIQLESESEGVQWIFIRVYSPELRIEVSSDLSAWMGLPAKSEKLAVDQDTHFETIKLPGRSDRVRLFYQKLEDGHILQVGTFLTSNEKLLKNFQQVFIASFAIMLLFGVGIGYFVGRHALSGVQRIRQAADLISRGNLSERIPVSKGGKEIKQLTGSFNRMQDRIQILISELHDVTDNIAHDLRSPVTRMRGLAETTLTGEQSIDEYRETAGAIVEECDGLVRMISTMLEIAENNAGIQQLAEEPVNVKEIIQDVIELYASVAEDKKITLSSKFSNNSLVIFGDRVRLQRALANLLDNALKFTQAGGWVVLSAKNEGDHILITIIDSGSGISVADLPHVYERFYRADQSRSMPGNGLGLSLVQSIVRAHGGKIKINSALGEGTEVTLSFKTTTA